MSKKTPNHKALQRITALEREVRRLRAGIRKDILHAVRLEVQMARRPHLRSLGSDDYSDREAEG